jgi:hypothetical protein
VEKQHVEVHHTEDAILEATRSKALSDVNQRAHVVTVRPDEIAMLKTRCPGSTEQMGSHSFRKFFNRSRQKAADTLIRREAKQQEKVEPRTGRVKITKRYLLQFFEDDDQGLPWLSLMQSLILVIEGVAQFHSGQEYTVFNTKLRSFNQIRKAASKKPGLFPPLEAALWSHPVILTLATRLQRAMCRGDGASAWKSSLFEGCYVASSDRDAAGDSLNSGMRIGDESSHLLRKLADLSGQFATDNRWSTEPDPPSAVLTPFSVAIAATTTAAHYPVHAFGESSEPMVPPQIVRYTDKAKELAHEVTPRDLRIEMLRRKRRARDALTAPREDYPLEAHADLKAQQRYGEWMLKSNVPAAARSAKAKMLPYFESLVSPTSQTCSPPPARRRRRPLGAPVDAEKLAHSSEEDQENPTLAHADSATLHADASASGPADMMMAQSLERKKATAVVSAPLHSTSSMQEAGSASSAQAVREGASNRSPQTAEDIGKLFLQMDALHTIIDVDTSEIGGFANRCPAGWKSGYRNEPMSKAEIRRARIVQKFCAGNPATAR